MTEGKIGKQMNYPAASSGVSTSLFGTLLAASGGELTLKDKLKPPVYLKESYQILFLQAASSNKKRVSLSAHPSGLNQSIFDYVKCNKLQRHNPVKIISGKGCYFPNEHVYGYQPEIRSAVCM